MSALHGLAGQGWVTDTPRMNPVQWRGMPSTCRAVPAANVDRRSRDGQGRRITLKGKATQRHLPSKTHTRSSPGAAAVDTGFTSRKMCISGCSVTRVGPTTLADQLASAGPVLKGGPCATIAHHYRQRPSGSDGGDHEPETLRRAHRTHPARVPCGGRALVDEGRQSNGTKGRRGR